MLGEVPNFEIASHTYSHIILRDHPFCGRTPDFETRKQELVRGKELVEQTFQRPCPGLRPGCGFYNALRGDQWLVDNVAEAGFGYVSSLLWGRKLQFLPCSKNPFPMPMRDSPNFGNCPVTAGTNTCSKPTI